MRKRLHLPLAAPMCLAAVCSLVIDFGSPRATAGTVRIGAAYNSFDFDGDGWADVIDNAPGNSNVSQLDTDGDGIGDARDLTNGLDADLDGDSFVDTGDANPNVTEVWNFAVTLTGPQSVTPGSGLSIPMTISGGNDLGPTGSIWAGWANYAVIQLQVDGGSVAAHWIGGHTETSLDLSAAEVTALGLDDGPHTLTARASDQVLVLGPSSTIQTLLVPEPSTLALAAFGFLALAAYALRRRRHFSTYRWRAASRSAW